VGGGGVYLGEEFYGGERKLWWPDGEITRGGGDNGERMEREERKEERKKEGLAEPLFTKGRQPCWHPTVTQGRQRGWHPPIHCGAAPGATVTIGCQLC
jgi:hypothetical protein